MSCFFAAKPYVLSNAERAERAVADFVAILTCPIWLPVFGATIGSIALREYLTKQVHHRKCKSLAQRLLCHAEAVRIGDRYIYWKSRDVIYVVDIAYDMHFHCSLPSIIKESWLKGTSFVIASVDHPQKITADFISELEATEIPQSDENDTIVVTHSKFHNIGNLLTQKLIDGYYGILANKFNIVNNM